MRFHPSETADASCVYNAEVQLHPTVFKDPAKASGQRQISAGSLERRLPCLNVSHNVLVS